MRAGAPARSRQEKRDRRDRERRARDVDVRHAGALEHHERVPRVPENPLSRQRSARGQPQEQGARREIAQSQRRLQYVERAGQGGGYTEEPDGCGRIHRRDVPMSHPLPELVSQGLERGAVGRCCVRVEPGERDSSVPQVPVGVVGERQRQRQQQTTQQSTDSQERPDSPARAAQPPLREGERDERGRFEPEPQRRMSAEIEDREQRSVAAHEGRHRHEHRDRCGLATLLQHAPPAR